MLYLTKQYRNQAKYIVIKESPGPASVTLSSRLKNKSDQLFLKR